MKAFFTSLFYNSYSYNVVYMPASTLLEKHIKLNLKSYNFIIIFHVSALL